jgi:hypothetical protein
VPYKVTVDGKVECVAGKLETLQAATYYKCVRENI